MDPILHTVLSVGLLFCAYFIGNLVGKQQGIQSAVAYLLHMGVCTENDLQKANEKFERDRDL